MPPDRVPAGGGVRARAHVELPDQRARLVPLLPVVQPTARPVAPDHGGGEVLAHRQAAEHGLCTSVLGDHGQTRVHGLGRPAGREVLPLQQHLPGGAGQVAEQGAQQLAAAGAEESGDAEHLPLVQVEVDALQRTHSEITHAQDHAAVLRLSRLGEHLVQGPADDHLDQVGLGQPRHRPAADDVAVTKHGDGVSQVEHLAEPVADVDDGLPRLGVAAQRGQQDVDLGDRQRGRRLV